MRVLVGLFTSPPQKKSPWQLFTDKPGFAPYPYSCQSHIWNWCPWKHTPLEFDLSAKGKVKRQLVHFIPSDAAPICYLSDGWVTLASFQFASLSHTSPVLRGITTLLLGALCGATARKVLSKSQSWWWQASFQNTKLLFCYLYLININDYHRTTAQVFSSHCHIIGIAQSQNKVWQER